jgi:hypothetical protein
VIVLATERTSDGASVVTVLPVTHRAPDNPAAAVEIPQVIKNTLGLDAHRSWVMISEGNKFVWPGYDLRKVPGNPPRYAYGFLPPRFFNDVLKAFGAWHKAGKGRMTGR